MIPVKLITKMSFVNFISALRDSFQKQMKCDVTFSCIDPASPNGRSTIKAHKYVLSLASEVFDTMFYGEAAKHEDVKDEGEPIKIDDIQMSTFKLFLSFIYTNLVDIKTAKTSAEFYHAAHKYNALDALVFIKSYMLREVNSENAIIFYDVACLYENQELKDACVKIFSESTMDVLNNPDFLTAAPHIIEAIYALDKLYISSEVQLINALERYIVHNQTDDSNIVEKVRPALGHIRFLTLFENQIARTTLLNPEDSLALIGCLPSDTEVSDIPSFLSSNRQIRGNLRNVNDFEMMWKLHPLYTDKRCTICSSSYHPPWDCTGSFYEVRTKLKDIYQKYKHVNLLDYNSDDLKVVYEIYKAMGKL